MVVTKSNARFDQLSTRLIKAMARCRTPVVPIIPVADGGIQVRISNVQLRLGNLFAHKAKIGYDLGEGLISKVEKALEKVEMELGKLEDWVTEEEKAAKRR